MATNQALGPVQIGGNLGDTSDTIQFDLGTRATGEDGLEFVYVKATEALAAWDAVAISNGFLASKITKTLVDKGYMVGSVPALNTGISSVAADYYFWACTTGLTSINAITGSSASVSPVYTTASAGALGTASGSQSLIRGVYIVEANASGATASRRMVLNRPQSAAF
jgi:hypothetical protein